MYKKNRLKDLIYIQENKPCNEQTIKGLFRSIVEPVLESNVESVVLFRLEDKRKKDFTSILKRIEFSNSKVFDFSDTQISDKFEYALKDEIWNKTEFVYVLTERFGAVLIFDYEECDLDNHAQIYTLYNSKDLTEAFDVISENSLVDLKCYQNKWNPDRRDNQLLNTSIRKIVENLNDTNQEVIISQIEKENVVAEDDALSKLDFLQAKSSFIAHEMRNLISICNLYMTIIEKQKDKLSFDDENIKNSVLNAQDCIRKSFDMCSNLLLDFKSINNVSIKQFELKPLISSIVELAKVYARDKQITFDIEKIDSVKVLVDEDKFSAVIINLIKNAVESIEEKGTILLETQEDGENVKLIVSNNGTPINEQVRENIFKRGFTTKTAGSGLGLVICKQNMEEQYGQLILLKSDLESTVFEITVLKGGE